MTDEQVQPPPQPEEATTTLAKDITPNTGDPCIPVPGGMRYQHSWQWTWSLDEAGHTVWTDDARCINCGETRKMNRDYSQSSI